MTNFHDKCINFNTTNKTHHLSYLKIIYMTNDNDINLILLMMYQLKLFESYLYF